MLLAFISTAAADDKPWAVPTAPYRVPVRLKDAPTDPENGIAIEVPEFGQMASQATANPVLTDAVGKPLPLAIVGMLPGKTFLALAKEVPADGDAYLYFGGSRPQGGPGWLPKTSVLLETRRLPADRALRYDAWPDARDAWQRAAGATDGIGFVPEISQGANPFGPGTAFISHYTGYLRAGKETAAFLYTQSSDASFVLVNDQFAFDWPGLHPANANAGNVRGKSVPLSSGATKIDYYQVKFGEGAPVAQLGWKRDGPAQAILSESWQHAGTAEVRGVQDIHNNPVPLARGRVKSYIGVNDQFYYEMEFFLPPERLDGWTVEWQFADGATFSGKKIARVLPEATPRGVTVHLRRGADDLRGSRRWEYVDPLPAASINDPPDRDRYLGLLDRETPAALPAAELRADLLLMRDYATDQKLAEFAQAWLQKGADSKDPLWGMAKIAALRSLAQPNPAQALAEFRRVETGARANHTAAFDAFEMELYAFYLRDPAGMAQIKQVGFRNGNSDLARLADIRMGDLQRLLGHYPEALAQYRRAEGNPTADDNRKLPAQDRAYSLDVDGSLAHGDRLFARQKMDDWELRHPTGKFENDFLLLRARVLMAYGRWSEGLAELESFTKIQPDNPFGIDADFYRARAMFEIGKKDDARRIWQDIAQKYPKHALAAQAKEWAQK